MDEKNNSVLKKHFKKNPNILSIMVEDNILTETEITMKSRDEALEQFRPLCW